MKLHNPTFSQQRLPSHLDSVDGENLHVGLTLILDNLSYHNFVDFSSAVVVVAAADNRRRVF